MPSRHCCHLQVKAYEINPVSNTLYSSVELYARLVNCWVTIREVIGFMHHGVLPIPVEMEMVILGQYSRNFFQ